MKATKVYPKPCLDCGCRCVLPCVMMGLPEGENRACFCYDCDRMGPAKATEEEAIMAWNNLGPSGEDE